MTTQALFQRFHDSLKLPRREVEFARGFRSVIEEGLKAGGIAVQSSFLQGSLAKKTMIAPLKDVDLVIVLSRSAYEGYDVAQVFQLVANALRAALRSEYQYLVVGVPKKYAIPIDLGDSLPSFDIVPAFEAEDSSDDILIGNTENNQWETSNTREMMRAVSEANQATGGVLVHVVRMVKNAVRRHFDDGIPGIAVEGAAVRALKDPAPYPDASTVLFARLADEVARGMIYDPTDTDDLIEKLEDGASDWLNSKAAEAARALRLSEAGNEDEAWLWWYRLFGEPFPTPPTDDVDGLKEIMSGLHVGASGPTPTRAWSRHF